MFRQLLLVALTAVSYASSLTIESSDNVNTTSYSQNDFIDPSSPNFRLGDYEVKFLVYNSVMGRSFIEVIIPHSVFTELSTFETVFISIPGYSSNPSLFLFMHINLYDQQGFFSHAISSFPNISLNEFMLAKTGFTVTDNPPYYENLFDPQLWDYNYLNYEIRLDFYVPTDFVEGTPDFLRDITLFTKLGSYWDGYDDGADNGYDDGYIDGYYDGYDDGSDNGYDDGYSDGYDAGNYDGFNDGYIDGIQEGITQAEGTWLGNLIFGTVGSVVGFIFAISDFEVLGVSIMSIITLFVAIGIIMLFIKLIKGTN